MTITFCSPVPKVDVKYGSLQINTCGERYAIWRLLFQLVDGIWAVAGAILLPRCRLTGRYEWLGKFSDVFSGYELQLFHFFNLFNAWRSEDTRNHPDQVIMVPRYPQYSSTYMFHLSHYLMQITSKLKMYHFHTRR